MLMRLQAKEVDAIVQAARNTFAPGTEVFLFGSRLQDEARGGDIDLLVETPKVLSPADMVRRRTRFVADIYRLLDEQRIDVVITTRGQQDLRGVVVAAKRDGLKLAQV